MNSNGNTCQDVKRLGRYLQLPKLELSSDPSRGKRDLHDEPAPSTAPSNSSQERFLDFRTRNLPRGLSLDASVGILDSLSKLHLGRADDVLHLTLSPHPDERFSERTWDLIWQVYAGEIGLKDHFAVIVRHGDGHSRWRERHGSKDQLVHEHGALLLLDPRTYKRTPITDIVQLLEIVDGYVEARFGRRRVRSRRVTWKPEQWSRFLEMRQLGALHRTMDARGEPVPLPVPPDLRRQRRDDRRRRYHRDKTLASEIRERLGDLDALVCTWEGLRRALAESGLEYRVGVFRPGTPPRHSGRIHVKDDRGSRRGVAAATVRASLSLDALVKVLGPYDLADVITPAAGPPRTQEARLPALHGIETLPQAVELLATAGFSYELRFHRTKRGKEAAIGYIRSDRTGKLQRAIGEWALSNLQRRFGSDAGLGLHELYARMQRGSRDPDTSIDPVDPPRALRPESEVVSESIVQRTGVAPEQVSPVQRSMPTIVPAASGSPSSAAPRIQRSTLAPTTLSKPSVRRPQLPDLHPEPVPADAETLAQPEGSPTAKSPSFSI